MRYVCSALTLLCLSTVLTGCIEPITIGDPQPMARGYASFMEPYKSAPGPTPQPIGYDYTKEANTAVIEDMRVAAIDLVEKLDQRLTFTNDTIYLQKTPDTSFYKTFDHLLREELINRGYVVASTPKDAITITFVAIDPEKKRVRQPLTKSEIHARGAEAYHPLYLALAFNIKDSVAVDYIGDLYEVPAYDFMTPTSPIKLKALPQSAIKCKEGACPTTSQAIILKAPE